MGKIVKFEIEIDLSQSAQTTAFHALLVAVGGQEAPAAPEPVKEEKPEKPKPRRSTKATKPKEEPKPKPEPKEETPEPTPEPEEDEAGVGYTLPELRALMAKKIGAHRDAVVEKFGELGAKNVSSLDPKHYDDFYEFLDGLK